MRLDVCVNVLVCLCSMLLHMCMYMLTHWHLNMCICKCIHRRLPACVHGFMYMFAYTCTCVYAHEQTCSCWHSFKHERQSSTYLSHPTGGGGNFFHLFHSIPPTFSTHRVGGGQLFPPFPFHSTAVSYTHLTLPTKA